MRSLRECFPFVLVFRYLFKIKTIFGIFNFSSSLFKIVVMFFNNFLCLRTIKYEKINRVGMFTNMN